jgi:hypothetical protein
MIRCGGALLKSVPPEILNAHGDKHSTKTYSPRLVPYFR